MKLSIITVNLNNVKGLEKTNSSILFQTWQDFEHIIIDGGSTDGSKELIEQFAINNKRLMKWISEPDTGIFNAMNKGIKISSGEYTLFLNSGDFLLSSSVLEKTFANCTFTEDFICAKCAVSHNGKVEFITNPPQSFTFKNFFNTTLAHQSTFIKAALFKKYGYYREDLRLKSDWEFFVRTIILNKCTTTAIDILLTDYNLDGVSALSKNKIRQREEMDKIYNESVLSKFVPDYVNHTSTLNEMKVYFWAKDKLILNWFIQLIYKTATIFSKIKKREH
jgi:glycosyltransferase involved in cell wall biosynthesis